MAQILIAIITHPAFNLVSLLLGCWLGNYFALDRDRRKEFNDAVKAFREAFNPELAALKSPSMADGNDPSFMLQNAFDKHRVIVEMFRIFLKRGNETSAFNTAWQNYYAYDNTDEMPVKGFIKYWPKWNNKTTDEIRKIAAANIESLLKFAEFK